MKSYFNLIVVVLVFAGNGSVRAAGKIPEGIVIRTEASETELLAANEMRRYAYLRTGKLLSVKVGAPKEGYIAIGVKSPAFSGEIGRSLGTQEFALKTTRSEWGITWWVVGGDAMGTLYGAYRFAEKLGVQFALNGDILPDQRWQDDWPEPNETGEPRFAMRGVLPFHNFQIGPDWWNLHDYQQVLTQMAKLRMNFFGLHTYPSWNHSIPGPEANLWIGLPEDVDEAGNIKTAFYSGVATTRVGWLIDPMPTSRYTAGAHLLFEGDEYASDFLGEYTEWPRTDEGQVDLFNRYGDFQAAAFGLARRLGIKTAMGTELPLGVPARVAERLKAQGMDPEDAEVRKQLYAGTFLRLMRKMPLDYYWFWLPEVWLGEPGRKSWEMTSPENIERDLEIAREAAALVEPPFDLASCGWRLGKKDDPLWLVKRTPEDWAVSSLVPSLGRAPVEPAFAEIKDHPTWVVAWAEDDLTVGARGCTAWDVQLWVERMFQNTADAARYGASGMMALLWRTAALDPNIDAMVQGSWNYRTGVPGAASERVTSADTSESSEKSHPREMSSDYWAVWGRQRFGEKAGAEAGRLVGSLDGSHLSVSRLLREAAKSADANMETVFNDVDPVSLGLNGSENKICATTGVAESEIEMLFRPLRKLESLRSGVEGAGNLERYDYWLNLLRATELRMLTWVRSERLAALVKHAESLKTPAHQKQIASQQILPLRLEVARLYEKTIAAFIDCARTMEGVGTIASIESGRQHHVVYRHDKTISKMLDEALPPEAALSRAYQGKDRIFVSSRNTLTDAGEPRVISAFVLSSEECSGVNIYWRPVGAGDFSKAPAEHRARHAYRAVLPAQPKGALVEYYLEAEVPGRAAIRWPVTAPQMNQTVLAW